ncbi:MAG: MBL fold metallo-hydrolase [Verrucomicrobia bacterium]|nr:MAG: MBL fold metallo-hydrolase [Verrucomicrobiota bacterium]
MEITFLGTGTSQGVPMIACSCEVCRSSDPRNKRSRASVHVVMGGLHIQVDAAPEFREQCIRNNLTSVDLFILTHGHADHVLGMDDLRRFCDRRDGEGIPVYSNTDGLDRVRSIYAYAIGARPAFRGYPAFILHQMPPVLDLGVGTITTTLLPHGRVQVLGLVFEERATGSKFAYYTDCKKVGPEARKLAEGAGVVVLDGLRQEPHPTHMSISEAVKVAEAIGAERNYLTHLTHTVDHGPMESELPATVRLAYDGLSLVV